MDLKIDHLDLIDLSEHHGSVSNMYTPSLVALNIQKFEYFQRWCT